MEKVIDINAIYDCKNKFGGILVYDYRKKINTYEVEFKDISFLSLLSKVLDFTQSNKYVWGTAKVIPNSEVSLCGYKAVTTSEI